ncbi:PEP-CTERM sorting domain-containing protein [Oxalobacteraceae bacterium]|nr:PEP-CTERM sorting domain-containing protein [Oxalobacteraceae bacterium]
MKLRSAAVAAIVLCTALSAQAAGNLIQNGSFDVGNDVANSYNYGNGFYGSIPAGASWYFQNLSGMINTSASWQVQGALGTVGFLQNHYNFPGRTPAISQSFFSDDSTLSVSFSLAQRDYGAANAQSVDVLFDGRLLSDIALTPVGADWTNYQFTVSGLAAGNHSLSFIGRNSGNSPDATAFIDNVSVSAVPEPATYGMLLAGAGLLGAVRRRAKK